MNQDFMKEKPVLPLVISMALPMTLSMLVNALYNIVDSYFVAQISENAMTALSLVYPIQNLVMAVLVGFSVGVNVMIAFYLGAKEQELADRSASLGMFLNLLHGMVLTILCLTLTPYFLSLFTKDQDILSMGREYSNIVFLFILPNSIAMGYEKIFQAVGRMKVSMICLIVGCVVNVILDPLMIFGIGPFPKMGITGAALATGIGQTAALLLYLVIHVKRPLTVHIKLKHMKPEKGLCKKLYQIGIPATLNLALPSVQVSALNAILSGFESGYVLVLGAYFKLQTFLYLTGNGVVQGMRPLIGFNHGAGEQKRVEKIYEAALMLIAVVMVIGTVLCLWIPDRLIGLFTANAQTIQMGKEALHIICIGFIASAVSLAVSGALEGLGKGQESLIISLIRYIVLLLPLAFFLSHIIGANGVFHAFWITEVITAVVSWVIWRRQRKIISKNTRRFCYVSKIRTHSSVKMRRPSIISPHAPSGPRGEVQGCSTASSWDE